MAGYLPLGIFINITGMKTLKLLLILAGLIMQCCGLFAQQTDYYTGIQKDISIGKELFKTAKYNAAYRQFEKIREKTDKKSEIYSEACYFMAVSALRSEHATGEKLLSNFVKDFPDSPYSNTANYYLGEYQFEKKRYAMAVRILGGVDREGLPASDQIRCGYMMGYSYMMTDEQDLALNEFFMIKDKNHILAKPATYYWAHINYLKSNYETALEGFRTLEKDPNFTKVIPMYVSQIYYKQERYNDVVEYVVPIINDVEESQKPELAKITGDSFFHLRRYPEAIQFLEYYHEQPGIKSREDNYIMGFSYYSTRAFEKSIPYLEKSSRGNDLIAQNSFYHLADSYIMTGQKEKALNSFSAASEMDFDAKIKEDALFNYAKLTYELSYSPFNETIKAFDKYITLYPNSDRNNSAYQYLVQVFMVTRNYRDAIAAIEKIKVRNQEINQAYQRVTYYRGLELFNSQDYEQALTYFGKSLENNYSSTLTAGARFWRAEALYRTGDYSSAISGFTQFLQSPGAITLPEYNDAYYSLGYAYFKLEDYSRAGNTFRKYLGATTGSRNRKTADVYNRLGDSYFIARDYAEAANNYQQAYAMKIYDADYALYQLAFCHGLQRRQDTKISLLKNLVASYPQSDYLDDALFELGRSYERDGNFTEAKKEYQTIIDKHRQSALYPKALLQMGLIHFNTSDYQNSLKYYQQVAENFRGTQESQAAMIGIKNCYIELNNVDAYFAYANKLGTGVAVTVSEQDSLTWIAAEKQFMSNDPNAVNQLRRYLQQYPNGSFTLNANFYLGELLYSGGKYSESLDYYLYVTRQPLNAFSEPALAKASELLFNAKKFGEALELYTRLETTAGNQWNKVKAIAGRMRCNFQLEKYRDAIEASSSLLKTEKAGEALIREAGFITARSYYNLGSYDQALPGMKNLATETATAWGAEARYLLADIYFRKQNIEASEKEILDFIDKGTSHQYWLAKSFILLADIYITRNDGFQAKHTLKSLIENYPVQNDGVIDEARQRLNRIETKELKESEPAQQNPMQINLK
jgi:TolA-binding protein